MNLFDFKISKASCAELRTQLIIAERVGIIDEASSIIEQTKKESKMIQKMISYRDGLRK